ncbi:MAG: HlyD family efflux transporter periplasmic adaptor subunit [Thermoanaerobaculia bacterium]|nr:HlyD family efflux transporter periplasmic adaptor subunit [Thermoanaerobaculia bacterium]
MDESPFLPGDPPPFAARSLAWLLIALFIVTVAVAVAVKVPETVVAPFALVPMRGTDPVRASRGGTVTEVLAVEGHPVAKGARLFAIRSQEFGDRSSERKALESSLRGFSESLSNARKRFDSEASARREEARGLADRADYLDRMLTLKREQLTLTKEQSERAKKLADQGLASLNERSDAQIRHSQAVMELEQLQAERLATGSTIEKLRDSQSAKGTEFHEEERALGEKIAQARIRIGALSVEASSVPGDGSGNELAVDSPCDGTVLGVAARRAGAVVREGEVLAEVVCSAETLQAELSLPQGGLARIHAGQSVRLLLEAFPYQRYGVRGGTVRWASPSGVGTRETATFPVLVDLDEQVIAADGERRPLLAGMRGTARVVVGRRTLVEYAFEPLRQLRENIR